MLLLVSSEAESPSGSSLGLLRDRRVAAFAADFFAQKLFHVLELGLVPVIGRAQVFVRFLHHLRSAEGIGWLFENGQVGVR